MRLRATSPPSWLGPAASDVGQYDRIVIQDILKEIAQTQQVDLNARQRFKGKSSNRCVCVGGGGSGGGLPVRPERPSFPPPRSPWPRRTRLSPLEARSGEAHANGLVAPRFAESGG